MRIRLLYPVRYYTNQVSNKQLISYNKLIEVFKIQTDGMDAMGVPPRS